MTAHTRLLTAEQVCEHFGIPSPRTVRTMRQHGLAGVRLGKAYLFDAADVQAFIESRKECHAQIRDTGCDGSQPGAPITSHGMKRAANDSALRAQATADRLKKLSKRSSGQVIALPTPARASPPR